MATRKRHKSPLSSVPVPHQRRKLCKALGEQLSAGKKVALTTHVNADGDGAGSEVALWHALMERGARPVITNPTPFPERFRFLLEGIEPADKSEAAVRHIQTADVVLVLDISDLSRLGHLANVVKDRGVPVGCIDHHVSDGTLPDGPRIVDHTACATGELIYDFLVTVGWEITPKIAKAIYVAIVTDTGGFRFSNTTARCLQIAANLIERGLQPEEIYRAVYASAPEGRVRLTAEVLDTLMVDSEVGLAWITVPNGALERHGVEADQLDGLVEYPRSIEGVDLAMMFRTIASGRIKVSFRSVGDVDVAKLAERFGGGGHRRAAGASFEGSMSEVQAIVLAAARDALRTRAKQ